MAENITDTQPIKKPTIPKDATVLVVEDNVANFVLIARMLGYLGIHCEWKTSGSAVVDYADTLQRLDVIAAARRHAEGVAYEYVQLFLNEIWKPFVADGRPQERWNEVRDAIERLRPLASEVLLAVFGLAMTEATERAFGREMELIKEEVRRDEAA